MGNFKSDLDFGKRSEAIERNEIWKDIPGYDELYQVSDFGNIRSFQKWRGSEIPRIIKQHLSDRGYSIVALKKNSKRKIEKVSRLVAIAFCENPMGKSEVNHKNGIKGDNAMENLEWVNRSENMKHAFDCGLKKGPKGILHGNSKLTEKMVRVIKHALSFGVRGTEVSLSKMLNVAHTTINRIKRGAAWGHIKI